MVDWQCRESEGKAKIEGYMSVSDEEAHHRGRGPSSLISMEVVTVAASYRSMVPP